MSDTNKTDRHTEDPRYMRLLGFVQGGTKAQDVYVMKGDLLNAAMGELRHLFDRIGALEERP